MSHEETLDSGATRRLLLKAAACLLGYPDEELETLLDEMRPDLERMPGDAAAQLVAAITALREMPLTTRAASYVASFDLNESRALYLTAHELGDSRWRGQALIDLRAQLRAAGFEPPEHELPDYLPALLEFISATPPDTDTSALERRLAVVCAQMYEELAAEDPYRPVFTALCALLPASGPPGADTGDAENAENAPAHAQRTSRFPLRERADTAELPYPLRYE